MIDYLLLVGLLVLGLMWFYFPPKTFDEAGGLTVLCVFFWPIIVLTFLGAIARDGFVPTIHRCRDYRKGN